MQSTKLIMLKIKKISVTKTIAAALVLLAAQNVSAQENSPYSRYGLGDLVPNTNVVNRSLGRVSAGYADALSVNFANPASYSAFKSYLEARSKKSMYGRVLLDVGINYENKTLQNPNEPLKHSSSYGYFSYLQVGIPLKEKWGLSFGLRPLSRISYKIARTGPLFDAKTGNFIDSAYTENSGNGGSFLPTIGTGFAIKNLSLGTNIGYLFGKKEYSTRIFFLNDTAAFNSSNHSTNSSFGGLYMDAGAQYRILLKRNSREKGNEKETYIRLGLSGNWEQQIRAERNLVRETFERDLNGSDVQKDSVSIQTQTGKLVYPASYTAGFVIEHNEQKGSGWLIGTDLVKTKWNNYRFIDSAESVQDNWQLRIGGHLRPAPNRNYFSNVIYRAGFFIGPDYINTGKELPLYGITFGMGLPLPNYNRMSQSQATIVNLGFEYSRRGNNENLLKENLFRVSIGLNFSDLWFSKRRYE